MSQSAQAEDALRAVLAQRISDLRVADADNLAHLLVVAKAIMNEDEVEEGLGKFTVEDFISFGLVNARARILYNSLHPPVLHNPFGVVVPVPQVPPHIDIEVTIKQPRFKETQTIPLFGGLSHGCYERLMDAILQRSSQLLTKKCILSLGSLVIDSDELLRQAVALDAGLVVVADCLAFSEWQLERVHQLVGNVDTVVQNFPWNEAKELEQDQEMLKEVMSVTEELKRRIIAVPTADPTECTRREFIGPLLILSLIHI
eukprot:TRINITY_DN225_c0_g1_i20.p1 TRINITY_DN225_c0_g1~~TRINITY_DN225_c0_g1_i20.p1  ORF type:complete len:258 (+),score=64.81 TRINITY_DN225_c0_g1_i20:182-955(+)